MQVCSSAIRERSQRRPRRALALRPGIRFSKRIICVRRKALLRETRAGNEKFGIVETINVSFLTAVRGFLFLGVTMVKRSSFVRNINWFLKENLKRPTRNLVSSTAFFFRILKLGCKVVGGALQICQKKYFTLLQEISRNATLEKRGRKRKFLDASSRILVRRYCFFVYFSIETHFFEFNSDWNNKTFAETRRMNFDKEILWEKFKSSLTQFSSVSFCYSAVPLWLSRLAKADEKSVKSVLCLKSKFRQSGRKA